MDNSRFSNDIEAMAIYLFGCPHTGVESICKEPEIFAGSALAIRGLA